MDQISDKKNLEENWVRICPLVEAMRRLPERERHIIDMRFLRERPRPRWRRRFTSARPRYPGWRRTP